MSRTFFPYIGSTLTLQPIANATYVSGIPRIEGSLLYAQTVASGAYLLVGQNNVGAAISTVPARTAPNIQTFTANGTWTRPSTGTLTQFMLWGGGGGGGSATGATSGARGAGGGGGPGSVITQCFCLTQLLPASATITVGSGGAGGVAAVGTGVGQAGTIGGLSSVAFAVPTVTTLFRVRGGGGGAGGTSSTGASSVSCFSDLPGGWTTSITNTGTLQTPGAGGRGESASSLGFPTYASAGASVGANSLTVPVAGGRGGQLNPSEAGLSGTLAGRIGFGGAGGAGGGGAQATLVGGAGGFPGGGGGGSGYRSSSQTSRPGGAGAGGYVIAITW